MSEGLRFLMGTFLCPRLVTRRKTSFSISSPRLKLTISLIQFTKKKNAIDTADPISVQDAYHI